LATIKKRKKKERKKKSQTWPSWGALGLGGGGGERTGGLVLFAVDGAAEDLGVTEDQQHAAVGALEAALVPLLAALASPSFLKERKRRKEPRER
jgi:hypothetical protein